MPARIKKGDLVLVLSGKDAGKKGKVIEVLPEECKVIVEKIAVVKRHQRASRDFQGGIIEKPLPIPVSKVMLICPRCGDPAKVGTKEIEAGKRVRACKRCEEIIDKV